MCIAKGNESTILNLSQPIAPKLLHSCPRATDVVKLHLEGSGRFALQQANTIVGNAKPILLSPGVLNLLFSVDRRFLRDLVLKAARLARLYRW
jgi:hypothetical protein